MNTKNVGEKNLIRVQCVISVQQKNLTHIF
jgi:hypothetical protein